jgi:nucleotide-binding universal stress UspA family protein
MVIVGVDFSAASARAVDKARALATRMNAEVEIVHVRQSPRPGAWSPDPEEADWLAAVGEPASRITLRVGTPWVELVKVADERRALLIVVGTHGRSGFQSLALGTTAARLALLSPRPTLLVGESPVRRAACLSVVACDPPIVLDQNGRRRE